MRSEVRNGHFSVSFEGQNYLFTVSYNCIFKFCHWHIALLNNSGEIVNGPFYQNGKLSFNFLFGSEILKLNK